jgi:hypothetical protein
MVIFRRFLYVYQRVTHVFSMGYRLSSSSVGPRPATRGPPAVRESHAWCGRPALFQYKPWRYPAPSRITYTLW